MRINNSQLDSEIRQVVVPVSMATTSAKIVAEALVKFDILVRRFWILIIHHCTRVFLDSEKQNHGL